MSGTEVAVSVLVWWGLPALGVLLLLLLADWLYGRKP